MTVIIIGTESSTTHLEPVSGITTEHGHDAEDVEDVGTLDISTGKIDTLDSETIAVSAGIQLTEDSAIGFTPFSNGVQVAGALYRFGRQSNIGDQTPGLLDGISMVRELDNEDQSFSAQLHPSQPTIDIASTKEPGIDWIRIVDSSSGQVVFAVHNDGSIETIGWNSGVLPDGYHNGLAVQKGSVYIGKSKLSELNDVLHVSHLKAPPYIPLRLTQAPYSFTTGNINANTPRSINDWMALARSAVTASAAKQIRLSVIFPAANAVDWVDSGLLNVHSATENVQDAIDEFRSNIGGLTVTQTIFVDSNRSVNGNGSPHSPYNNLSSALTAHTADGNTTSKHFYLANGVYTGGILLQKASIEQDIIIEGESRDQTIIQAGTSWTAGKGTDLLVIRDFNSVTLLNCTLRYCRYAWYPRDCNTAIIKNCYITYAGVDSSQSTLFDGSLTAAQQATLATSSTTSGGAMRVRACNYIEVLDTFIYKTFRGFRIQDCGGGRVQNNHALYTLDNQLYFAAGTYNGSSGSSDIIASNNFLENSGHHGITVIGGANINISNNVVRNAWASGFNGWHIRDCSVCNNTFENCNWKGNSGYSAAGENFAQIYIGGDTNINAAAKYMVNISNNQFIRCGNGNVGSSKFFFIHSDNDPSNRPTSVSSEIKICDNKSDCSGTILDLNNYAAKLIVVPQTVSDTAVSTNATNISANVTAIGTKQATLSTAQLATVDMTLAAIETGTSSNFCTAPVIKAYVDANSGGGSSLELLNNSGNAFLKVETNTDQQNATTSIILRAESSNATLDRQYDLTTDAANNDDFVLLCTTNQNGTLEGFRFNPGGRVSFAGGNNPITSFSGADFQVRGSSWFRSTMRIGGVTTLEDNVIIGAVGGSKTLTLNGAQITASPASPTFHHWVNFNKPATGYQLGSGSHIISVGDGAAAEKSVTYYVTLPTSPQISDYIEIRCLAKIHLQLHTENTNVLYTAVFDSISNNKSITYSCFNGDGHGIITYVQHPQTTTQFSWVSTTGALY